MSYRSDPYSGGQGVYMKYLSRALAARGHGVTVVSGKPYPDLDAGIELIRLPGENLVENPNRLTAFQPRYLRDPTSLFEWASVLTGGFPDPYAFGRRAADYLDKHGDRFDIVHDNQSLAYGLLTVDQPTVATVHHPITADRAVELEAADSRTQRMLIRRWYRFLRMQQRVASRLPHILVPSAATKRRTIADFNAAPEAISVVPNGVDTRQFRPRPGIRERPGRVIATVSADVPLKGTRYLLEAFAIIRERHPDAELLLIGELKDGGTAAGSLSELGLGDAVQVRSDLPVDRLAELYCTASVAVVPSVYEGFGLPAVEAMASGVPIVATTGGALPEVVGEAGRLVAPRDASAMADAVSELLADRNLRKRLGRRARSRVVTAFDWDRTAKQTVDVYRQAIDAHR
ncbi:MAG: glycosyltransferase family 4 protein [Salinirussus sp.]